MEDEEKMMHFDIDRYANLKSPFHTFDPRAKILCLLILMVSIVLLNDIKVLLMAFIGTILIVIISKIPIKFVLKRLKWVTLFAFAILIVLPFSVPGDILFSFGFISISEKGLMLAIMISLRAFSVMLLVFPMISTMNFVTFIKALEQLKLPNKLVQMIFFIYRYIFVVSDELQKTLISISSRNTGKKSYLFKRHILSNIIGMILVRSYERGERIRTAMLSRGYNGNHKTFYAFRMTKKDLLKFSAVTIWSLSLHFVVFIKLFDVVGITNGF